MVEVRITAEGLEKAFATTRHQSHRTTITVDDWSSSGGEAVHLLGQSGAGKSTVLAMVGGYLEPTVGKLMISVEGMTMKPAEARQRGIIACCFQQPMLEPRLTAAENCRLFGVEEPEIERHFVALGILELRNRRVVELSGGQQRRVSLARALGARGDVCIVDEPLAGLDAETSQLATAALEQYCRDGNALVFASHQPLDLSVVTHHVAVWNQRS